MRMKKVLCPTDFSDASLRSAEFAANLARHKDGSIDFVHVRPLVVAYAEEYPYVAPPPVADETLHTLAMEQMEAFKQRLNVEDLSTRLHVKRGAPAPTIVTSVDSLEPDLVVMGTHGRSGLERYALGSVAERVLRKTTRPVLTIAGSEDDPLPEARFSKILCPVDFSEDSLHGLKAAQEIAKESRAELTVIHVLEWAGQDSRIPEALGLQKASEAMEGTRLEELRALRPASTGEESEFQCQELVCSGKPYERILEQATERGIDLIVMGIGGRNRLGLALFGSATHRVVRRASCPVLTVRVH